LDPRMGVVFNHEAIFREHLLFQSGGSVFELRTTEDARTKKDFPDAPEQAPNSIQLNAVAGDAKKGPAMFVVDSSVKTVRIAAPEFDVTGKSFFENEARFHDRVTAEALLEAGSIDCKTTLLVGGAATFNGSVTTNGSLKLDGDVTLGNPK